MVLERGVMGGHREIVEGQWEAITIKCTSPTAMSISRSEILRRKKEGTEVEQEHTKCPIDAHCHRHCRKDPRITKYWEVLQVVFDFGKKFLISEKVEESSEAQNLQNFYIAMQSFVILGSLLQW